MRLLAVKRLANLAAEIRQRQTGEFRRGLDRQLDLFLAVAERVSDLEHAGVLREAQLELVLGGAQARQVGTGQLNVDVRAGLEQRGREALRDRAGDAPRDLTPQILDLGAPGGPGLAGLQLDRHLAEV